MKVLILTRDGLLADILSLALEGVLSAECEVPEDEEAAAERLRASKDVDLLVAENDGTVSQSIEQARKQQVPVVRITQPTGDLRPGVSDREFVLIKPVEVRDFLEIVRHVLQLGAGEDREEDFCRVRLDTLLMIGKQFEFDIFVKLSDRKFIKMVAKGDVFDSEKYAHFQQKKIQHLYVPRKDFLSYLNYLSQSLDQLLSGEPIPLDATLEATASLYDSIREGMQLLGITPETQRLMQLTVNLVVRSIGKNVRLKELLNVVVKNKDSFQAWHSVALSFVACKLCSLMTWDSQNTHFKLAMAALLHDVALRKPEWACFESEQEAREAQLSEQEMNEYLQHPLLAGDLVRLLADFPGDVDYIISQHHELPDGSGFPKGLNHTKISPLSSLFIVSHDLCHRLYAAGSEFNFLEFLKDFDERYPMGYFRKIRTALENLPLTETGE